MECQKLFTDLKKYGLFAQAYGQPDQQSFLPLKYSLHEFKTTQNHTKIAQRSSINWMPRDKDEIIFEQGDCCFYQLVDRESNKL